MSEKKLPENITPISLLQVRRDKGKRCTCYQRSFEIDTQNREVTCTQCGAIVDPYEALLDIAKRYERLNDQTNMLLEQRKEILNWQPHLLPLRKVEKIYRGGNMLPSCPHCGRGIQANELTSSVNKEMELEKRKFEEGWRG